MVLTCQNTGIEVLAEDVAVQAREVPDFTVRLGVWVESRQVTALMAVAGRIVIVAVAVKEVCAWAIAVMVTTLLVGTVCGAVYLPFVSIVPKVEFPPATPPASQFTRVLLRFRMLWVHCTVPFTSTEVAAQEIVNVGVAAVVLEPPPQEFNASRA